MHHDNPILTQILSVVLAVGLHAAVLFGHFSLQPSTIGYDGVGSVELAPGPPGDGSGEFEEPPPPPPPPPPPEPGESLPEPPSEEEAMAEEPKPDDIPEPDAVVKDQKKEEQPRINVQYESPVYSTNKMSAAEAERAIRFLLEHGRPGTGQVGSKPGGGGGGGGGKRFGSAMRRKGSDPEYPYEARKMRQEGMVVLDTLIGTDGKVLNLVVKESSGHTLLDQSAIRAVRRWEIEPNRVAGIPVNTRLDVPIIFRMEGSTGESPSSKASPQ